MIFAALLSLVSNISAVSGQSTADLPTGTYTSVFSDQDIPNRGMQFLVGTFTLTFEDGQYVVEQNGRLVVEGTYTSTAEQIELTMLAAL
jgi:hypothetical protein